MDDEAEDFVRGMTGFQGFYEINNGNFDVRVGEQGN